MTVEPSTIQASYNGWLVALSIVIATLASYVTLDLTARVAVAKPPLKNAWLIGGAFAMGTGIWAMHYTGMLAYRLPFPVLYDVPTVLFSLLAAVLSSLVALYAVGRPQPTRTTLGLASVLMGAGIVLMHYSGMAAMRMPAMHHYRKDWLIVSVLLAPVVSYAALQFSIQLRSKTEWWRALGAVVMGSGIAFVHYSGMFSVSFMPAPPPNESYALDISSLANTGIIINVLIVLGFALLTSMLDRALSRQAEEIYGLQAKLMSEHNTVVREAARVRLLLDSTVEGMLGLSTDGNCTFCNRAALRELGYDSEQQLIGAHLHDVIHHHTAIGLVYPEKDCPFSDAIRNGRSAHVDNEIFWRADGTSFPVECWVHPILRDEVTLGAVITFWNASKRRAAEEAHRRSDQLFRSIAENSADLIAVVDKDGNRIYNSPSYLQILGFTPEELKQTPSFEQIHPDDRDLVRRAAQESWRTGIGAVLEYRMQHKNGTYVSLESHGSFIRNSAGEIEAFVVSARDISGRKYAAQSEKLSAIGQLAAGIAHEINTPMQYVSDNVSFLKDTWSQIEVAIKSCAQVQVDSSGSAIPADTPSADLPQDWEWLQQEVPKALAQSLDGIRRITKIVSAMRRFSHSSGGEKQPVDINEALETTLTVAHNEVKHVADVELDLEPGLPLVRCVPDEMNQVFLNLIVNAAHAMRDLTPPPPSGRGKLTLRSRSSGDNVQIEISDTGAGIPENVRSRIFEPFFTTKRVGEGTGQGLTIAYDIVVQKHKGKIWFETEVGKETTFFIRIPIDASPNSGEKP